MRTLQVETIRLHDGARMDVIRDIHAVDRLLVEHSQMRTAIERALNDSESGAGWGPDVTVCAYLRAALPNVPHHLPRKAGTPDADTKGAA
jgi:hypothetical protein